MAKEFESFYTEQIERLGEPEDWQDAFTVIGVAGLELASSRHTGYGKSNLEDMNDIKLNIKNKYARLTTLLASEDEPDEETLTDTLMDLANYAIFGIMLRKNQWLLPMKKKEEFVS